MFLFSLSGPLVAGRLVSMYPELPYLDPGPGIGPGFIHLRRLNSFGFSVTDDNILI